MSMVVSEFLQRNSLEGTDPIKVRVVRNTSNQSQSAQVILIASFSNKPFELLFYIFIYKKNPL